MSTPEQPNPEQLGFFFYRRRGVGRPSKLPDTPQELWDRACEYFDWVEATPFIISEKAMSAGSAHLIEIPKARPMTQDGLCAFLCIDDETWRRWHENEEFCGVISAIDRVMRAEKFEGAASGIFNANIISRDLGLADRALHGSDPNNPLPPATIGTVMLLAPVIAPDETPPDQSEGGDTA